MADARQLEIVAVRNGSAWPNSLAVQFFTSLRRHSPDLAQVRSVEDLATVLTDAAEQAADKPLDRDFFALHWSDFDWLNSTMLVRRAIVDGVVDDVKTKYSKAGLPLARALADLMLHWRSESKFQAQNDWSSLVSWRTLGRLPFRSTAVLEEFIKPAAGRANLGVIGWHTLRRTFSTLLRGNGVDIKVQQELMPHADIRTR